MSSRSAFTLIEMMCAIMILAIITIVTGITFTEVTNSWERSTKVAERMQGADYAINQVVAGLRSAYYPAAGTQKDEWGLAMLDNGDGEKPTDSDIIEWTKLGNAIIGDKSVLAETSHRVRLWVEEPRSRDEPGGLWARVWNPDLYSEEGNDNLDDEEYGEEFLLVEDIVGFDCVVQKDTKECEEDGRPKWSETWDTSNSIPWRVKLTFRLKPPEKGDEPLPILRVVEIPLWYISQNPVSLEGKDKKGTKTSGGSKSGGGGATSGGNGGAPPLDRGGAPRGGAPAGGAPR